MYSEDLERIVKILDRYLKPEIKLGFHSHNNQQLSFALTMQFVELLCESERGVIVDSSLCGMGRGAGNATTELVANYLNRKHNGNYDMNAIMDAIDVYMQYFMQNYSWGYSTPYFIAGMYCCHVNNIAYLLENHRTNSKDMRNIIESLTPEQRKKYDYDLLEEKYIENQSRLVDDADNINELKRKLDGRKIVLVAPGKSSVVEMDRVKKYISDNNAIAIAVNAIISGYDYDYMFITNSARYDYAKNTYKGVFGKVEKIISSNVKKESDEGECIINFNNVIKRGWEHFDNAMICCLRLMEKLHLTDVAVAGFDGFKEVYNESYADAMLPSLNVGSAWSELNDEVRDMYQDFKRTAKYCRNVEFLTESYFE
jgi:4-hydroxy 2-oxovalerate aldolase